MSRRQFAWIAILIVDVVYFVWGASAAASPTGLAGPGGAGILPAGYQGFAGASWDPASKGGGSGFLNGRSSPTPSLKCSKNCSRCQWETVAIPSRTVRSSGVFRACTLCCP